LNKKKITVLVTTLILATSLFLVAEHKIVKTTKFNWESLCIESNLQSTAMAKACAHIKNSQEQINSEDDFLFALTDWVSGWVKVSENQTLAPANYWRNSLSQNMNAIEKAEFGVYCGGTAWFLMQIFEEFGFKSFTYNFGDRLNGPATHVLTLVKSKSRILAFDSYLDLTYTSRDGNLLDFRNVLNFIEEGNLQNINFLSKPISRSILLKKDLNWESQAKKSWLWNSLYKENQNTEKCVRGLKNVSCPTYNANYEIPLEKLSESAGIYEFLKRNKKEQNLLNLLPFSKGVSSISTGYVDLSKIDVGLAYKISELFSSGQTSNLRTISQ